MAGAWVYVLRCRDGSLYTGWSTDVARRLARHRAGRASRYTASRLPVELALALPMPDAGAARREEARIKRLDRPGKLALIGHDGGDGQPPARPQRQDLRR
jgi:predicted GIY-YIG superfamily endonuclease